MNYGYSKWSLSICQWALLLIFMCKDFIALCSQSCFQENIFIWLLLQGINVSVKSII